MQEQTSKTTGGDNSPSRFQIADWQQRDIDRLVDQDYSANWSEMG